MNNPIPTYLQYFAKRIQPSEVVESQLQLCSSSNNTQFEIWYYGDLLTLEGEVLPFISGSTAKIIAKDPLSAEEILLFDATLHGYNALFCDDYTEEHRSNRPLQQYNMPATEVVLSFFYNIDYDEEADDYEVDKQGNVQLMNGKITDWETVKRNGYDAFIFYYKKEDGTLLAFAQEELA
ncbi:hypothetical protein ACE1MS_13715 [Lysinibacillus sp. fkY74-1]|uniref:hypothetical protein n=1 Tax=Lysinibacillus TaxID=400634 RepID=UPI0004DEEB53|nr:MULTISPECIES: hypothetical protein [Lysinibacillus]MBI6862704.1 hypothetical protein [Lysinibacillus fusiformis]MEB7453484.1 hypothetical protein [Lysinibacillus sphaericus]QIC46362.1 hypothetical protein GAG94_03970 [Lysinibacillus sphaericus]QPA57289.1 hypothetical protein INQ55_13855 [Lysinibacillus sphaericus]